MLTPKERDNLADLQERMSEIETVLRRFNRRVETLLKQLECTVAGLGEERFEQPEVAGLMTLNRRLAELEQHLRDQALALDPRLRAKLADPTNRMYDYEIDAEIAYVLREDDEEAVEDDDNILTRRDEMLKHMGETRILADGMDHRESGRPDMAQLDAEPHCWLFHDLYDHSYGFSKPSVPLRDCLRIGKIWVDVVIRQQYCLDIATGEWSQPSRRKRERGSESASAYSARIAPLAFRKPPAFWRAGPHHQADGSVHGNGFCRREPHPLGHTDPLGNQHRRGVAGECWDLVESHEAGAVASASGYFCTLCVLEARVFYPSREALWRDHLFETFLEWVNDKLLKARWIGIYGSHEIGGTWVKLLTDRPEHEREQDGEGVVVPLWNDATFLK